jgi:hypothetical protein
MAFRLTKDQLRQKETLRTTLREAEQAFESAITAYNQAAEQAAEWVQTTADSIRSEYDSKSERWQDSRTGQAVSVWLDEWDNFDADIMELPESVASAIENLPDRPGVE